MPAPGAELFDTLEQRLALYATPFLADPPPLSAMENNFNTVVRMQTTQGVIDIELYDAGGPPAGQAAPRTVENFLNYVRTGRYDGSFFHRLANNFVLQGGGFSLQDPLPSSVPLYSAVVTDAQLVNEFHASRSNVAMTIAMAKLGGQPDSATSQFFFNLANNASNLDNQNGGFTVFGRVIAGWTVVTTIAGFATRNLDQFLAGGANVFGQVPLSGPNNTDVVSIVDVEVIKRKNQTLFFTGSTYFPDGFRNGVGSATVELVNPNPTVGQGSQYMIIARYESGLRDRVVAEGFIFAGAHLSIPIYRGGDPTLNKIRPGTPFAFEVRFSRPMGASINRTDFGATSGESFVTTGTIPEATLETWTFANGHKGTGLASFLHYVNLTDEDANLTIRFFPEAGTPWTITKVVRPFRRGGLDAGQLPLVPAGLYSVRITSDQPLVAGLSQYRFAPARAGAETGQIGGEATRGVLPGVIIPTVGQTTVAVLYNGTSPTSITVNFDFILTDGTVLTNNTPFVLTTTVRRRAIDLSTANGALPRNTPFTVRYRVQGDAAPVSAALTSVIGGDHVLTPFQTFSTQSVYFADGFTDPTNTNNDERISIFNPFRNGGYAMTFTVKFHFVGGGTANVIVPAGGTAILGSGERADIRIRDLAPVMAKIQSGTQFRHYSISISATFTHLSAPVDGAVFAMLNRTDTASGNTIVTGPSFAASGPAFAFNDPHFNLP